MQEYARRRRRISRRLHTLKQHPCPAWLMPYANSFKFSYSQSSSYCRFISVSYFTALYLYHHLSIYLSIYLSIHLSIHLSISFSVFFSLHLDFTKFLSLFLLLFCISFSFYLSLSTSLFISLASTRYSQAHTHTHRRWNYHRPFAHTHTNPFQISTLCSKSSIVHTLTHFVPFTLSHLFNSILFSLSPKA